MTNEQLRAACEAIVFSSGEPIEASRIAQALEVDIDSVTGALWELQRILDERKSGVCLLRLGSKYQLCSRIEYAQQVRSVLDIKKNAPLSAAALEVLAVVAYNQPVTKAYVEQLRGVDSAYSVGLLLARGLIADAGRLNVPGRPIQYVTTPEFLRTFGLSSLDELPDLDLASLTQPETDSGQLVMEAVDQP